MTIPALPSSPTSKYTTSGKSLFDIKQEDNKFLPETEQQYDRKHISSFTTIENYQGTSKLPVEAFLTHLPEALQLELNTLKKYCSFNDNLVEILNGNGVFYNRLIILLKKIDRIMAQNGFSDRHKIKVEKTISQLLTGGKLDLVNDIGRELNHLEEYYQSGSWLPNPEDRSLFDQDDENPDAQYDLGDFFPRWMKETEIIPDILTSTATLAYWNFRHSQKNNDKGRLSDNLIRHKDKRLFDCIRKLRELKAAFHNPDNSTSSSPSSLTKFHIDAIASRFDYADKVANAEAETNSDYRTYYWDDQSPCTQKQKKQGSKQRSDTVQAAEQTLNGIAKYSPTSSTSSFVEEESNKPINQTTDCSARIRRPNPKYQKSSDNVQMVTEPKKGKKKRKRKRKCTFVSSTLDNKFSRMEKEKLLKETGIPELETTIKSVLEEKEQKLVTDPKLTTLEGCDKTSYHQERAEVIAAQDELSRLYDACRQHFGIRKSSFNGDMSTKSVSIKSEQNKIKESRKLNIPEPSKPPYIDKPTTYMSTSDRKPNFSEAQNALITMLEKSRELSLKPAMEPEKLRGHSQDFGYAPTWQPLSTVLKFPMPFLTKLFTIEGNENPKATIKIKEKVPELVKDIKMIINLYRHNSTVWCPDVARETLNPVIQKVREVQLCFPEIINAFKNKQHDLSKSNHHTTEDINRAEDQLKELQKALAKTAIVLSSLEDFSAYLKSEKQQELYNRLLKAMAEWSSCIANTSESLFPAPPVRIG
ncbi:hypothetical protein [Endozoicomonas sp. YOMI1]|uniref:hypothetical protein n=1 Tax=Endozoicomonas sp. YOMI1 TaxID=2828739 RepID=UPI00214812E2|nr:hypothetical protein [Endozoicomonas sp. YOMI1]